MSRWVLVIPAVILLTGLALMALSTTVPHGLPHRPFTALTNWGQGRNPGVDQCPLGTVQMDIENLFLECQRGTN